MFEEVKNIIVETLSCNEAAVTAEADIFDNLGADSLDAVELNLAIEEKLGVSIDEERMAAIKTVGDIISCLEEKLR